MSLVSSSNSSASPILTLLALLPLVVGCPAKDSQEKEKDDSALETGESGVDDTTPVDLDDDGFDQDLDCDDTNPEVNPGAAERCNGVDDDCDLEIDEDPVDGTWFFRDSDGDSYGEPEKSVFSCEPESGWVSDGTDCDDHDASVHPGATERWSDRVDQDCDGETDLDPDIYSLSLESTWTGGYAGWSVAAAGDCDGDGLGDLLVGGPHVGAVASEAGQVWLLSGGLDRDTELADAASNVFGAQAGENAGWKVASAGDHDADGLADMLVGAPGASGVESFSGAVYLLRSPQPEVASVGDAAVTLLGFGAGQLVGNAIAGGEDLDGDALPDIVVGTGSSSVVPCSGSCEEKAWIVPHPEDGTWDLSSIGHVLRGDAGDTFGSSGLELAGDVDGDGFEDLVVGLVASEQSRSRVRLFLGPLNADLSTSAADSWLDEVVRDVSFTSVAGVGDLNGDGYADIAQGRGSSGDSLDGRARVFLGPILGDLSKVPADATLVGDGDDYAGYSLAGLGDTDGDGMGELVIGAPLWLGSVGEAFLLRGPISGVYTLEEDADARLEGRSDAGTFGKSLASAGDLDGDGLQELAVGQPLQGERGAAAGAVYLFLGE